MDYFVFFSILDAFGTNGRPLPGDPLLPHQLHAEALTKLYSTGSRTLVVLDELSLQLASEEGSLAILGPSGSGKSTLLHILGSLDTPTSGQLSLDGVNPLGMSPNELARHRSQRIGFVFQDHYLLPQLTAIGNVLLARLAIGKVRAEDEKRAEELLEAAGLADRRTHLPSQLSGGERQRVAIARALINRPAMLLCDEPTGNLDAPTAAEIGEMLHRSARAHDAILIIATHSASLAATCQRRVHLVDGKLVNRAGTA